MAGCLNPGQHNFMNPVLIPGITYTHGAFESSDNILAAYPHSPGSWQAQGGGGGVMGQDHMPMAQQPQVYAQVNTAAAIAMIPR